MEIDSLKHLLRLLSVSALAAMVGACSGTDAIPNAKTASADVGKTMRSQAKTNAAQQTLYVLNSANPHPTVSVYSANGKTLIRTIDLGPVAGKGIPELAVNSKQQLLATNGGVLDIYGNRGAQLVGTLKQSSGWNRITVDESDNLYTDCGGRDLCEYANLQQTLARRVKNAAPIAIATDQSGDVGVISAAGSILVYPPTGTNPSWTLSNITAYALAFDQSGNLYVSTNSGIAVYAPATSTPSRTISLGSSYASALYFDASGNLYVIADDKGSYTIQVFAPGGSTPTATISSGLDTPVALAFGAANRLYVANHGHGSGDTGSAIIYQNLKEMPVRTIKNDVYIPTSVAFTQ
jgi:glucose/arabinose dehydrogenase